MPTATPLPDPFDLQRFELAQSETFSDALAELQQGRKTTHWMWFIFPQLAGLGTSAMARKYAISGRKEAEAYLAHPSLGSRLGQCSEALLQVTGKSVYEIMGAPDDVKLRSSMTLFARISPGDSVFQRVLQRYYSGTEDERTVEQLSSGGGAGKA